MSVVKTESKESSTVHTEDFDKYFILASVGPGLWQAFHRATYDTASPRYNDRDAAKHYAMRELKQETEDAIHEMLGGTDEHIRS